MSSIPYKTRSCSQINRKSYTNNLLRSWGIDATLRSIEEDAASRSQHDSFMEDDSSLTSKKLDLSNDADAKHVSASSLPVAGPSVSAIDLGSDACEKEVVQHPALRSPWQVRFLPPGPPPNRPLPPLPRGRRRSSEAPIPVGDM